MWQPHKVVSVLFFLISSAGAQSTLKFMGSDVTITDPGTDDDGFFPRGPASVCIEGTPRQCYTMPKEFGRDAQAEVMEIKKGLPALLFSAASGGISGWQIHFTLLRPGQGKELEGLFECSISNQNQHVLWTEPSISDAALFITAEPIRSPGEGHYSEHRYIISTYVWWPVTGSRLRLIQSTRPIYDSSKVQPGRRRQRRHPFRETRDNQPVAASEAAIRAALNGSTSLR